MGGVGIAALKIRDNILVLFAALRE